MDMELFQELAAAWKNGFRFKVFSGERYSLYTLGLVLTARGVRLSSCERKVVITYDSPVRDEGTCKENIMAVLVAVAPQTVLCLFEQNGMFAQLSTDLVCASSGLLEKCESGYRIRTFSSVTGDVGAIVPLADTGGMQVSIFYGRGDGAECVVAAHEWASIEKWINCNL